MRITEKLDSVPYSRYLALEPKIRKRRKEIIICLEHNAVITAGVNAKKENFLFSEEILKENKIDFVTTKRGGDYTAHEKGQTVIYPHIDLLKRNLSITEYLQTLLRATTESIFETWGLETFVGKEFPGVYLTKSPEKKLVSIGVSFRSYFTSFGIAINVSNDLNTFRFINPCGRKSGDMVSIFSLGLDANKEPEFRKKFLERFISKI